MAGISQDDVNFFIQGYPTGYPWIDYLTDVPDCFFPEGAVSEVMGLKSTAKSTLIFEAIAKYHRDGGTKKTLYLDFEKTVKKQANYLASLGVDIANPDIFVYVQPTSMQEGGDMILKILRGKVKGETQQDYAFIVVDTVAAMRPEQEIANAFGDTKQQGLRGKLMSELLRNLTADLADDGPAVIFVNQIYEQISINKGPAAAFLPTSYDSSASNALKYYASFRVTLTLKSKIKSKKMNPITFEEDETFVGSIIEAMTEKSKIGVPFRKAKFVVKYGFGVDPLPTLLAAAAAKGGDTPAVKISANKAIYSYNQGDGVYSKNFQGVAALEKFLIENPDEILKIAQQVSPLWENCFTNFTKKSFATGPSIEEEEGIDV